MLHRGRCRRRLITGLLTAACVVAFPLQASASGTKQYVALGDSYAAGQGGGSYLNGCLQSRNGYPSMLDELKHVHLRADSTCSGATTDDLLHGQLQPLNRGTRLVTVTVGGNDLNVAGVAASCIGGPSPACTSAINAALKLLTAPPGETSALGQRLAGTYAAVVADAPKATVVVTGYPYLFEAPAPTDPNAPTIVAINNATTALNQTIQATTAAAAGTGADIVYVDVTAAFAGHGIGSLDPYLNAAGPDAFHPNVAGYAAYTAAIKAVVPLS
jgi:lysophospholipase L1-like esterase